MKKELTLYKLLLMFVFLAMAGLCISEEVNEPAQIQKLADSVKPCVKINTDEWTLPNPECIVSDGESLLLHKAAGAERVTSGTKYLYATLQAQIRFGRFENGINYYIGFMGREPWAKNVVWLNNDGAGHFFLVTASDNRYNVLSSSTTSALDPNQWYTFHIEWKSGPKGRLERLPDTVNFYLDGVLVTTYTGLDMMPNAKLPVVFDMVSAVPREGLMEVRNIQITSYGETARETKLSDVIPIPPATYEPENPILLQNPIADIENNKATLENGFLRCKIDLESQHITSLFNKYIKNEMIQGYSRLMVVNAQGKDVSDSEYQLLEAEKFSDESKAGLNACWKNSRAPFELKLRLCVEKNSPEMVVSLEVKNTGSEQLTLGITAPLIENIRIGDKVEDDYYFYPMMTGWCGTLPVRFRHAYGFMAWMQLLSVFDSVVGGGVFTYTCDKEGVPKNLIINKRNLSNEDPVPHSTGGYSEDDPGEIFGTTPATAMAIRHLRYELKANESCRLPNAVIGVSKGDWHDSFNHYKAWVRSWFQKRYHTPRWLMDNYDYISRWPNAFLDKDEQRYVYSENMGINEKDALTEWFGWWNYPKHEGASKGEAGDFAIGDYDYSPRAGGLEGFRNEVENIHKKRGRIMLYTNPTACWQESSIGKLHGIEWARMNPDGRHSSDWYEGNLGYNACCYEDGWQKHISERLASVLKETGADAYRLDVAAILYPCYNPNHKHYDGTFRSAVSSERMAGFLDQCSAEARRVNPDAAVLTEHAGTEYLAQYIDGYLTQQFRWDSSFFAQFRGMSSYNLVFMRFLLPELKVLVFGLDPEDGGRRAFFNAVGQDRSSLQGEALRYFNRTHRVLIENGDAAGTMYPEPLIPTLQAGLMANAFPGDSKRLWTLCNRNSTVVKGELLAVEVKKDVHYVEALNDVPLLSAIKSGKMIISGDIEPQQVICIVELPKILNAQLSGKTLKISVNKQDSGLHVEFFVGEDDQDKVSKLYLEEGKCEAQISSSGNIIVKLIRDKYLLDQVIIMHSEK